VRIFFLFTLLLMAASVVAADAWEKGGAVSVNGNVIPQAVFLKNGRSMVFPVLAIAQALGKEVSVESGAVTWEGKTVKTPTLMVIDNVPYLAWKDLARLDPALEYGIAADRAVFALGARKSAPVGSNVGQSEAAGEAVWLEDFAAAKAQAARQNKRMLLDFTGSNWCGWCKKLDAEVFATPEFKAYAAKNLILVKLDFPRGIPQPEAIKKQNEALAREYGIDGFPTLIILGSNGVQFGELPYQPGGPAVTIASLEQLK